MGECRLAVQGGLDGRRIGAGSAGSAPGRLEERDAGSALQIFIEQQESTGESGGMAIWEAGVKGKCSADNGVAGKTCTMTTGRPGLR